MEIKQDMDFGDLENLCWGQARKILEEISDADKEDAFMNYLEDTFYDDQLLFYLTITFYFCLKRYLL